ncbi:universal stress protein [Spartinivicinus ruber]|uniref:universal stress protein n=1 Tax=Spartinivicinus ruber TaxID=2683272 RepID=UPI0013CFA6B9|nr:universal stress protein [Spartinivicinus ruber]
MNLLQLNSIIVPVDFSEECAEAVNVALELAEKPTKVTLLHVKYPASYINAGTAYVHIDEERHKQEVETGLQQFILRHGWQNIESIVLSGDPGNEIATYAEKNNASLIIIPTHGYHGFKRLMLGSVADRVINLASCPVLILKRKD